MQGDPNDPAPADWFTANAPPPPAASGFTPDPGHGTVTPPGTDVPGLTGPSQNNPSGDAATWLMAAINRGVPPQTAIDALNNAGGAFAALKAAYYPSNNTIGLANGTYLTTNPQGVWGPVTRSPEGGGGGGTAVPNPSTLPTTPYGGFGSTPSPYVAPTWTGGPAPTAPNLIPFTAPTQAELEASPGYASRLTAQNEAINTSAGANGSLLNGGTLKELAKYGQDYASNEYGNLFGQSLQTNQNNNNVLQGNFGNAFQTYQANYGAFVDQANRSFNTYQANVGNTRNANQDYWGQLNSLYQTGASLAGSSYKPSNAGL